MNPNILLAVLYAGLGGTLLALIVATVQQKWSCKVFFLLALRLAIGWHFLFEGLHKVHSHYAGPTETSRPFSSEPYFRAATGPLGPYARLQFADPARVIADKVRTPAEIRPDRFAKLTALEQAVACPPAVAKEFDAVEAKAEELAKGQAGRAAQAVDEAERKLLRDIDEAEQRALKGELTPAEVVRVRERAEADRTKAATQASARRQQIRSWLAGYQEVGRDLAAAVKGRADGGPATAQLEAALRAVAVKAEDELKAADAAEQKAIEDANAAERQALSNERTEDEKAKIRAKAAADRDKVRADSAKAREALKGPDAFKEATKALVTAAKAKYARWVHGVDPRPAKVKFVSGDVTMTAPQRLAHLERLRAELKAAEDRQAPGLGNGFGTDTKRVAELRADVLSAESDLAKDAEAFVAELKKELTDGRSDDEKPAESPGQFLDRVTMWFLVGVGACLMAGFCTRLACVAAAGFLVVTYLLHPPVPWHPLPPNTEGNPVFVNKNVIECLALLALACFPTGRWLGVDALFARVVFGPQRDDRPPGV